MTGISTWRERAEAHPDGGQAMSDKIKEIRDRVEQDVAKGPANKEIYRVHKDRAFLLAEVDRLRRHVDALQEKVSAESCACGYDSPDAVCLAHSPQLSAALADVERLTRERDEARAEVERLRADAERFRWLAGQKRLHLYTDGGTWTRDDGTTFRAWGVLAANGVGYPPAETLAELVDIARKDQEDGR